MHRVRAACILFLLALFLLPGCVTIRSTTEFHVGGSGVKSLSWAIDDTALQIAKVRGISDPFAKVRERAKAAGATVEDFHEGGQTGVVVRLPFASIAELEALGQSGPFKDLGEESHVTQQATLRYSTFAVRVRLNVSQINALIDATKADLKAQGLADPLVGAVQFSYVLVLPAGVGEIVSHNASRVDGDRLTWDVDLGSGVGTRELETTARITHVVYAHVDTVMRPDGGGERRLTVALARGLVSDSTEDPFAGLRRAAQATSASVEPYEGMGRLGIVMSKPFADGAALRALGRDPLLGCGETILLQRGGDLLRPTFAFTATLASAPPPASPDPAITEWRAALGEMPDLRYSVTMPGRITAHNAAIMDENTLTWRLDMTGGQVRALTATSEAVNDVVYPAGLAAGGCLCAGSLAVLVVLLLAGYQVNRRLRMR
jgi:hypothetical protein